MSNVRKNALFKILEQRKQQNSLESARQLFEAKTFVEQFESLKNAILHGRFLFHFFSISTGFTFLYLLFDSFLHFQLASISLSIMILIFWEYVKSNLLEMAFIGYYRTFRFPLVAIAALFMLSGSVFTSLHGTKDFTKLNDTSLVDYKNRTNAKIESINNYYNSEIRKVKTDLSNFEKSVSWKGKINIYDATTKQTISRYNNEISNLHKRNEKEVSIVSNNSKNVAKQIKSKSEFNLIAFVCLSAINEILIVLCLWFLIFYKYKRVTESELFEPESEGFNLSYRDLNRFAELVIKNSGQYLLTNHNEPEKQPNKIGFSTTIDHSVNQANFTKEQEKTALSKANINGLISDIKNGITDYRTLMQRNGVNVNTVKKYLTQLT